MASEVLVEGRDCSAMTPLSFLLLLWMLAWFVQGKRTPLVPVQRSKCPQRTQPWALTDREKKARDVDVLSVTSRIEETTLRGHCRQRRASCRRSALTSRTETTLSSVSSTRTRQIRSTYICGGIRRYIFAVVSRPSTSSYNSRSTAWTVRTYMERLSLLMWRIRRRRYRTSCTPGACQSSLHFLQSSSLCLFLQNSEK